MSYILDALRKSEAERNRDVAPGLLTAGSPTSRARSLVTVSLIVVLALNAVLLAAWLSGWRPTFEPESTPSSVDTFDATVERPASRQLVQPQQTATVTPPAPTPAILPPPANDASLLPSFEFSTHVYSSDPELRAVTIEGRRFQEGDTIAPDVRLIEITESGAVLDYRGARIDIDVLQDWR